MSWYMPNESEIRELCKEAIMSRSEAYWKNKQDQKDNEWMPKTVKAVFRRTFENQDIQYHGSMYYSGEW